MGHVPRLAALLRLLRDEGYAFRPLPGKPWGFISEASFQPLASPDGAVNLDIHVAPDCYPADRALTTERLFAQARAFDPDLPRIKLASLSHGYFLLASNAAKDKFGPFAVKKALDALRLRAGWRARLAQREIDLLAQTGQLRGPNEVFHALLAWLEGQADPPALSGHWRQQEYGRLQREWATLFTDQDRPPPGAWPQLRREYLLCTEKTVFLANNLKRLKGLLRPRSGMPDERNSPPSV